MHIRICTYIIIIILRSDAVTVYTTRRDIYERFQGGQMTFRKVTMGVIRNRKIKKKIHYHRERERSQPLVGLTAFWNRLLSSYIQVPVPRIDM